MKAHKSVLTSGDVAAWPLLQLVAKPVSRCVPLTYATQHVLCVRLSFWRSPSASLRSAVCCNHLWRSGSLTLSSLRPDPVQPVCNHGQGEEVRWLRRTWRPRRGRSRPCAGYCPSGFGARPSCAGWPRLLHCTCPVTLHGTAAAVSGIRHTRGVLPVPLKSRALARKHSQQPAAAGWRRHSASCLDQHLSAAPGFATGTYAVRSGRSEASAARGRHCAVRPAPLNNALFPPLTRVRSPVPQPYQHRGHRPRRLRQVHHHRTLDLQAGRCVPLVGNPQLSVCSCEVADALPLAALLQASTSV